MVDVGVDMQHIDAQAIGADISVLKWSGSTHL